MKKFHLGDLLSVTTGRLVSSRHMDGVYDILNYLTGDSIYTHQIPRAMDACRGHVLAELPFLADVPVPGDDFDWQGQHAAWLAEQVAVYGESFALAVLPQAQWQHRDPLSEAAEMIDDPSRVIPITDGREQNN